MGSYEILMKLSLAAMVRRCNTTAQLHCKSAAACLPLRGMCATRSGLLHLLHKHGEMARATIRPRRESVRPHAARKLPAMQADCRLALEAVNVVPASWLLPQPFAFPCAVAVAIAAA